MARPPKPVRFSAEDYADAPEGVAPVLEKLFLQLNPFLADATGAVEGRLTVGDNLAGGYKAVEVAAPATAWTAPTLSGTWANYGLGFAPAGYRITPEGRVHLRGAVKSGASASAVFTLPTGYRPEYNAIFRPFWNNGGVETSARVDVSSAGVVTINTAGTNTFLSLEDISFDATSPAAPVAFVGPGWPINLKTDASVAPKGVDIAAVRDLTSDSACHDVGGVDWRPDGKGGVIVRRVGGLTPGRRYQIVFRFLA